LQALEGVVVLRIHLELGLVICDRIFVLLRQAVGVPTLRGRFHVVRICGDQECVIGDSGVVVLHASICQRAPVITLQVVRFLLNDQRKIGDSFIPLIESDLSEATKFNRIEVVRLEFQRLIEIREGGVVLLELR
jgi:hypothetical protein